MRSRSSSEPVSRSRRRRCLVLDILSAEPGVSSVVGCGVVGSGVSSVGSAGGGL